MTETVETSPLPSSIPRRVYASDLELIFGEETLSGLKKGFAPDYHGFTEDFMGKSQIETYSDRTGGSATTEDLFPPARYITLDEIVEKSKMTKNYVDLTGEEPDKEEIEKIQQILRELLLPPTTVYGKKNFVEGEVNVDLL